MSLHKAKPTSAGRRFVVTVKTPDLHKGKPHAPLLEKKSGKGGRNNNGRITVRHQGGGHKQHYRLVDFKRDKDGIPGVVDHESPFEFEEEKRPRRDPTRGECRQPRRGRSNHRHRPATVIRTRNRRVLIATLHRRHPHLQSGTNGGASG